MPPLPIIPDTFRVTFNWNTAHGVTPRNVMHFRDPSHSATEVNVASVLDANVQANQWAGMCIDFHFDTYSIIKLDGLGATHVIPYAGSGTNNGGTGGDCIPNGAAVVSFKTGLRGRRNRGRIFLGPIGEPAQADGLLTSTIQNDHQLGWDAFLSGMQTGGIWPVVASYRGDIAHDVQTVTARHRLCSMRRRLEQIPLT